MLKEDQTGISNRLVPNDRTAIAYPGDVNPNRNPAPTTTSNKGGALTHLALLRRVLRGHKTNRADAGSFTGKRKKPVFDPSSSLQLGIMGYSVAAKGTEKHLPIQGARGLRIHTRRPHQGRLEAFIISFNKVPNSHRRRDQQELVVVNKKHLHSPNFAEVRRSRNGMPEGEG